MLLKSSDLEFKLGLLRCIKKERKKKWSYFDASLLPAPCALAGHNLRSEALDMVKVYIVLKKTSKK